MAIAFGSIQTWIGARGSRPGAGISHTAIAGLLHWTYLNSGTFTRSFAMVVVLAGGLVFVGGMVGSQQLASLFSFIALAASGLWIALYATHYSPTDLPYSDLRLGAWLAIGGSVIGLLSSFFVRRHQM
jgi:hypothetical protein